jgi:hypothetical protein
VAAVIAPFATVMAVPTAAVMPAATIIPAMPATVVVIAITGSKGRSGGAERQQGGHRGDNKAVHLHS